MSTNPDITVLLEQAAEGNSSAANDLFAIVYDELRKLAALQMSKENAGHTLQSTALVHEVWVKLVGRRTGIEWKNREHFFSAATQAMRRILVDSARARQRKKRGGDVQKFEIKEWDAIVSEDEQLIALDEALQKLNEVDCKKAKLVELRFFGGLTNKEAADQLSISTATAERYWAFSRAWLRSRMEE